MLNSYHKGELRLAVVHNCVAIVYIILLSLVIATHICDKVHSKYSNCPCSRLLVAVHLNHHEDGSSAHLQCRRQVVKDVLVYVCVLLNEWMWLAI